MAFLPKRGLNIHENEVMRAFKTVNDGYIEPISFIVPRRAEVFQGDIYPPVIGTKPAMGARGWLDGGDGIPPKIDLESVYAGEEPTEIPSNYKPRPPLSPKMAPQPKMEAEPHKEIPQPSPVMRSPPPSMKEQTSSIANLASKFTDKDELDSEEDDSSSFEEIPKPVDRSERQTHAVPKVEEKTELAASQKDLDGASGLPTKGSVAPAPIVRAESQSTKVSCWYICHIMAADNLEQPQFLEPSAPPPIPSSLNLPPTPAIGTEPIQGYLQEIKSILQQQNETMAAQSAKIGQLTAEVDHLKTNLTSSSGSTDKDARIKQLEQELASLRS